jgi:hypothetical protein
MPRLTRIFAGLLLLLTCRTAATSQSHDMHGRIVDTAFAMVLRDVSASLPGSCPSLLRLTESSQGFNIEGAGKISFGNLAELDSTSHLSMSHLQKYRSSILDQLRDLDSSTLLADISSHEELVTDSTRHITRDGLQAVFSAEQSGLNVIDNFLIYHLIALHLVRNAGAGGGRPCEALFSALVYEARAQNFLVDASSSGHMLVPPRELFGFIPPSNRQSAHDNFSSEGTYVMNSLGDQWQNFGDRLMEWYPATRQHLLDACTTSLRELFLVFGRSQGLGEDSPAMQRLCFGLLIEPATIDERIASWVGRSTPSDYYASVQMPSLLRLPFPISATWSVRSETTDTLPARFNPLIAHRRIHYPQIKNSPFSPGLQDNSNSEYNDNDFMFESSAFPAWLMPEHWVNKNSLRGRTFASLSVAGRDSLAAFLIHRDTDVAAVRFIQVRDQPPSYDGLLLSGGFGYLWNVTPAAEPAWSVSLGYGFQADILKDLKIGAVGILSRPSVLAEFTSSTHSPSARLWSLSAGFDVWYANIQIGAARFDQAGEHSYALLEGFGFDLGSIRLPCFFNDVIPRIKIERAELQQHLYKVSVQLIVD